MLGWQIPTDDETIRKSGVELTQFLDIYENSFKRWIYVPGFAGIEFVHKIKIHNKDYLSHFHSIFCNLKISNTIAII